MVIGGIINVRGILNEVVLLLKQNPEVQHNSVAQSFSYICILIYYILLYIAVMCRYGDIRKMLFSYICSIVVLYVVRVRSKSLCFTAVLDE